MLQVAIEEPGTPSRDLAGGTTLSDHCRPWLLTLALVALTGYAVDQRLDAIVFVTEPTLSADPAANGSVGQRATRGGHGSTSAVFEEVSESLTRAPSGVEGLRLLCLWLRAQLPGLCQDPDMCSCPRQLIVRTGAEAHRTAQLGWDPGASGMAAMALDAVRLARQDARLVVANSGQVAPVNEFVGVEVWLNDKGKWALIDPLGGRLYGSTETPLSATEVRAVMMKGAEPEAVALAQPPPLSYSSRLSQVYPNRFENLWTLVASPIEATPGKQAVWALLDAPGACTWPWRLRVLLYETRLRFPVGPSSVEVSACFGLVPLGLLLYMAFLCWRHRGQRRFASMLGIGQHEHVEPGMLQTALRDVFAPLRAVLALASWTGVVGLPMAAKMAKTVSLLPGVSSAYIRWRGWGGSAGCFVKPSMAVFGSLVVFSTVLAMLQVGTARPSIEEDAYISFRYARTLAETGCLSFNAGERGVEGFSNMLWVLTLAAGCRLGLPLPECAFVGGIALLLVHIWLVAWIATRVGPGAWVPVLLLCTNVAFCRTGGNGLETSLTGCLITLVVYRWICEDEENSHSCLLTAFVSFMLVLTRADGAHVFAVITLGRLLEIRRVRDVRAICNWLLFFAGLCCSYAAMRFWVFGTVFPHVLYARLLSGSGTLEERFLPGLTYVANAFHAYPALLFGVGGAMMCWGNVAAARMALVVAGCLSWTVAIGGDGGNLMDSRFVVPTMGLLALLAQRMHTAVITRALGWRLGAVVTVAAVLVLNARFIEHPDGRGGVSLNPLVALASSQRVSASLLEGLDYVVQRGFQTSASIDQQVARHIAKTFGSEFELVCYQAGQMAWTWPGQFRDVFGLATHRLATPPDECRVARKPRLYVLHPSHGEQYARLTSLGYRVGRVYALLNSDDLDHCGLWFVLLAEPPIGSTSVPKLFDETLVGGVVWRLVPPANIVVLTSEDAEEPLFDGGVPGRGIQQLLSQPPARRQWLSDEFVPWTQR